MKIKRDLISHVGLHQYNHLSHSEDLQQTDSAESVQPVCPLFHAFPKIIPNFLKHLGILGKSKQSPACLLRVTTHHETNRFTKNYVKSCDTQSIQRLKHTTSPPKGSVHYENHQGGVPFMPLYWKRLKRIFSLILYIIIAVITAERSLKYNTFFLCSFLKQKKSHPHCSITVTRGMETQHNKYL